MSAPYSIKADFNVPIQMRDGATTYADIFRPDAPGEQFPVLLTRTPYDKSSPQNRTGTLDVVRAAMSGYAAVVQDVRGRFTSEGEFYTFTNEINDGYDSIEWLASQPWCTGKVGTFGISYVGATQWLAAKSLATLADSHRARLHRTRLPRRLDVAGRRFRAWLQPLLGYWLARRCKLGKPVPEDKQGHQRTERPHRIERLTWGGFSHLPMQEMPDLKEGIAPYYYDWLSHADYDDYWKQVCIAESHSEIAIPAFNVGGWYDIFLGGTIQNYLGMRANGASDLARNGQRLLIGPWIHSGSAPAVSGEYNFGTRAAAAAIDLPGEFLRYYDHHLKGEDNGVPDDQPVRIFVMGINEWRYEDEWPLERAQDVRYYLHSGGRANTLNGDGRPQPRITRGRAA